MTAGASTEQSDAVTAPTRTVRVGDTEVVLLGNLALRTDKKILWDSEQLQATNAPELDQFIRREYRKGWTLG